MFLLVSGASGAGKSTARRLVADKLEPVVECLELRDVVPMPRVPPLAWRQRATWERWNGLHDAGAWAMYVLDTSRLTTGAVASELLAWCRRALAGQAPSMSVRS
jgi:hypothetical protein